MPVCNDWFLKVTGITCQDIFVQGFQLSVLTWMRMWHLKNKEETGKIQILFWPNHCQLGNTCLSALFDLDNPNFTNKTKQSFLY
jgi:hypothetical protein